jgi:hypothetical protein
MVLDACRRFARGESRRRGRWELERGGERRFDESRRENVGQADYSNVCAMIGWKLRHFTGSIHITINTIISSCFQDRVRGFITQFPTSPMNRRVRHDRVQSVRNAPVGHSSFSPTTSRVSHIQARRNVSLRTSPQTVIQRKTFRPYSCCLRPRFYYVR